MPDPNTCKRIHLIAMGGSVMHNFALALHEQGHRVSGSDDEIYDPARSRLAQADLLPEPGWHPSRITSELDAVILGMHARKDNPELQKAQSLGLPIYSFPAYFHENTRDKRRIVVAGSHGKTTTTAILMHVLRSLGHDADFLIGALLEGFDTMVQLSDAPIAVIEGDEYLSSALDPRPKFLHFDPQLLIITGIAWDHVNVFSTFEKYLGAFRQLLSSLSPQAQVFWYRHDPHLPDLIRRTRPIAGYRAVAYEALTHHPSGDVSSVHFPDGTLSEIPLIGRHNMENLSAAFQICQELSISEGEFANAMRSFPGAHKRMSKQWQSGSTALFVDFAHAPSKVKATVQALHQQYPESRLVACVELHTFSSLQEKFMPQYAQTLSDAEVAAVFISPHTLAMKNMPRPKVSNIREAFERSDLKVFFDKKEIEEWWHQQLQIPATVLLLMTSGRFDGAAYPSAPTSLQV